MSRAFHPHPGAGMRLVAAAMAGPLWWWSREMWRGMGLGLMMVLSGFGTCDGSVAGKGFVVAVDVSESECEHAMMTPLKAGSSSSSSSSSSIAAAQRGWNARAQQQTQQSTRAAATLHVHVKLGLAIPQLVFSFQRRARDLMSRGAGGQHSRDRMG